MSIVANQNWPRWVNASVTKWFKGIYGESLYSFAEGEDRTTEGKQTYCEIRMNGPSCNLLSPNLFKLTIMIDVLVVAIRDPQNMYSMDIAIGIALQAFTNAIPIYKYGSGSGDDGTELCCMKLTPDVGKDRVEITRFGQSNPAIRLQESTIQTSYESLLSIH